MHRRAGPGNGFKRRRRKRKVMDMRAVATGVILGGVYVATLLWLPGMERARLAAVPLLLATGLVAGAGAGLAADNGPRTGGWHGLAAGTLVGAGVAATILYTFIVPGAASGAFYAANYLLATSAGQFSVVAQHGSLVVAVLAGLVWGCVAALGLYAGRQAPLREDVGVIAE